MMRTTNCLHKNAQRVIIISNKERLCKANKTKNWAPPVLYANGQLKFAFQTIQQIWRQLLKWESRLVVVVGIVQV